jgi:glycosyltransferase involved in cell wall biosynthesis
MYEFSLIVATLDRVVELECLLASLLTQDIGVEKFEVIIVDQNKKGVLDNIINNYKDNLNLVHVVSDVKGGSINRNIGLHHAKGNIVTFPDDDCYYYPDTLSKVLLTFTQHPSFSSLLGQIYDRTEKKKLIRNWSETYEIVNQQNFFMKYSMITIFTKTKSLEFDELLGSGKYFGAYEDADYILRLLKESGEIFYTPEVHIWHPQLAHYVMDSNKVIAYGHGFGAFCKKNLSVSIAFLFFKVLGYHFAYMCLEALKFNFKEVKRRYLAFSSRLIGFYQYKN